MPIKDKIGISLKEKFDLNANKHSFIIRNVIVHVCQIVCLPVDKFHISACSADLLCSKKDSLVAHFVHLEYTQLLCQEMEKRGTIHSSTNKH